MIEVATVIEVFGDSAKVSMDKKPECDKCGMCLFPKGAKNATLICKNLANANVGDRVKIETKEKTKTLSMFLVFLVPLILIAISAILGYYFIKNELYILLISVGVVAVWYFILSFIDKRLKINKKFYAEITEKL